MRIGERNKTSLQHQEKKEFGSFLSAIPCTFRFLSPPCSLSPMKKHCTGQFTVESSKAIMFSTVTFLLYLLLLLEPCETPLSNNNMAVVVSEGLLRARSKSRRKPPAFLHSYPVENIGRGPCDLGLLSITKTANVLEDSPAESRDVNETAREDSSGPEAAGGGEVSSFARLLPQTFALPLPFFNLTAFFLLLCLHRSLLLCTSSLGSLRHQFLARLVVLSKLRTPLERRARKRIRSLSSFWCVKHSKKAATTCCEFGA
jgi:hypothetical protein